MNFPFQNVFYFHVCNRSLCYFFCSFFLITKTNVRVVHSLSTTAEDSEDNELGMSDDSGWNDATAYPGP